MDHSGELRVRNYHWRALSRNLHDDILDIHDNAAEQAAPCGIATARKNCLLLGNNRGDSPPSATPSS